MYLLFVIFRTLHKGPSQPYTDADFTKLNRLLSLEHLGNTSAQEVSATHSHLYGPQLSNWIDELVIR